MIFSQLGLLGLFLASFLAATVVPFSSEIVLSFFIYAKYNIWQCIILATLGNWLGGMTGYYLGLLGKWDWIEKYLRIKQSNLERMQFRLNKMGGFAAVLSWIPFIGDLIPVALGLLRCKPLPVWIWLLVGKTTRYLVWAYLSLKIFN